MTKDMLMGVVLTILVLLLALMLVGWWARRRRQADLGTPQMVPADPGEVLLSVEAHYVATTKAGAPLDRIAVGGLGFRARAGLAVTSGGLVLAIPGQRQFWIPAADITGVGRATWTIDRVVERDGLVVVGWPLPASGAGASSSTPVESYFRFDTSSAASDMIAALERVITPAVASPKGTQ